MRLSQQTKAQSLSTTLSTGRTEVRGWSAGVTGAVYHSDLDFVEGGGPQGGTVVRGSRTLVAGFVKTAKDDKRSQ